MFPPGVAFTPGNAGTVPPGLDNLYHHDEMDPRREERETKILETDPRREERDIEILETFPLREECVLEIIETLPRGEG